MKFANFSSTAALAVALLAASANAGYPDEADGHVNRRLPAGGNGNGQGQGQGNGKPGADDDEIGVIVVWKNANGRNELNNFAKDQKVNDISSKLGISALKTFRGNWNALKNNPNFESVEIDAEVHALPYFRGGNDEESDHQQRRLAEEAPYGVAQVQADQLSGLPLPDPTKKKTVCVVDTGYALGHEDLPDASYGVNGYLPSGYSGSWNVDGDGHGTHCAGTIGAIGGNGKGVTSVNPDPSKFSFFIGKGLQDNGSGSTSGVMEAVTACKDNGANVISMSLGGGGETNAENSLYEDLYKNDDVLIIAAAGNDGNSAKSYPASYNAVMSVAAVDSNENKASFSQYNEQVEIAGPGVNVKSTIPNNQYDSYSGTSMATPHVAGVAALVWNHFPDCKAWQIRNVLVKTAKEAGPAGCDNQYGFGIVQAKAAYDLLAAGGCAAGGSSDATSPVGGCARENLLSCSSSSECNDSNPCTTDTCSNSVCVHTVSDPTCTHCGNGVCEAGEDTGNCPTDCPCVDNPEGWYDADGPDFNCNWYAGGSNCASYGDSYANLGTTANQACCVCGGGSPTSGGPTNPPPTNPPPTNPPPTNPPPTNPPPTNPPPTNPPPTNPPPTNPPPTNPPPTNPPPTNPPPTNPPPTNPPPTNPPPTNPPPTNPPPTNSPPSSCVDVTVKIRTDDWGYETSWTLSDSSSTTLMSGAEYGNNQIYTDTACLPNNAEYVFTIFDDWGDGIYSPGYYRVTAGSTVLAQGSNFGYGEYTEFVLGNIGPGPCNECVNSPLGWYDVDGPYYDCAWYAQGSNCADLGDYFANFGKTANQACCACGGGESICSTAAPASSSTFLASAKANAKKKPSKGNEKAPQKPLLVQCPKKPADAECSDDCHCPGSFCKGNGSCK